MKATVLVRSIEEEPVILNAREVIADCESLDPDTNINKFSVCGKKVMAQVRISQEMMEMEMMDRKFQSQMFMGMDPLDRMSNPWDEEFGGRRGGVRGRRGGMMGRGPGWGGVVRRPDPEYLAYSSPS